MTMRSLFTFVRHVNSGRTNYEAPDLMLYVMAMDNIYLRIHEIKRLIRLGYHYEMRNRTIPNKIYSALGVDITDTINNMANYRARLNMAISKANSLAVPSSFNLFARRTVLGSVVLTDEPNRPTQLIIPEADGYYTYNSKGKTGGRLEYVTKQSLTKATNETSYKADGVMRVTPLRKLTVDDLLKSLENELSTLLSDEDINIMSGDILKAYGNNLYSLKYIEENEALELVHDENLLMQFKNSTVLDLPNAT